MAVSRRFLERSWIVVSIAYGGVRTALVWSFLSKYGVNPWGYAVTEVFTSAGYGLGTARLVACAVDRQRTRWIRWAVLSIACFLGPDIYIFASAREMPPAVLSTVLGIVATTTVIGAVGLARRLRTARAAGSATSRIAADGGA